MAVVEVEHPCPEITLLAPNRPGRLNAVDFELVASLHDARDDVGIDDSYFLPRLIGAARAFDPMVTGRTVGAAASFQMGIVSQVFADEELARRHRIGVDGAVCERRREMRRGRSPEAFEMGSTWGTAASTSTGRCPR